MKKKNILKIMSLLLIVPMLGITSLFAGCKKETAYVNDIKDAYNAMVYKYQKTNTNSASNNTYFTFVGEVNNKDYFSGSDESSNVDHKVNFSIDLTKLKSSEGMETNLKDLYDQLENVYSSLLKQSNDYFLRYQKNFFGTHSFDEENKNVKKDLYNVLQKLKKLDEALADFDFNLQALNSIVDFIGPTTQAMSTKLKTFNSVYLNLINANFEFNMAFCNTHVKYTYGNRNVDIQAETAENLVREAALKYAYGYFISNLQTYNHNGSCDTTKFTTLENPEKSYELKKYINYSEMLKLFGNAEEDGVLSIINKNKGETTTAAWKYQGITTITIEENDPNRELKEGLGTAYKNLYQMLNRYNTFLDLYKSNAKNIDMYTYNQLKVGNAENTLFDSLDAFRESLTAEKRANLDVVENFTNYDLNVLLETINNILKYNA